MELIREWVSAWRNTQMTFAYVGEKDLDYFWSAAFMREKIGDDYTSMYYGPVPCSHYPFSVLSIVTFLVNAVIV